MSLPYETELARAIAILPTKDKLEEISYRVSLSRSTNKLKVSSEILASVCQDATSYSNVLSSTSYWEKYNARVKTPDSIERKVLRNPDKEFQSVFNDLLVLRIYCKEYPTAYPDYYRVVDMRCGKKVDDGYRGIHLYYKLDNFHYIIEIQIWSEYDSVFNIMSHKFGYKSIPSHVLKQVHEKRVQGCLLTESDYFEEVRKLWND